MTLAEVANVHVYLMFLQGFVHAECGIKDLIFIFNSFFMPIICYFYGIKIAMFYDDHCPPHFHVFYNEYQAIIDIQNVVIFRGHLPQRAFKLVREWATINQQALMDNWNLASEHKILFYIDPLS